MHSLVLKATVLFFLIPGLFTGFEDDYKEAVEFTTEHRQQITSACKLYNCDTEIVTSVIFPELVRYSHFSDFFETKALEFVYVSSGSDYADFSIGRFQMKPSFIEKMENYVKNDTALSGFAFINEFKSTTESDKRRERLLRLESLDWQLRYICCFYNIMQQRFSTLEKAEKVHKISIYATAYNHGFDKSLGEIKEWENKKTFPYGCNTPNNPYSYSEVALNFYRNTYMTDN